MSTPLFIQEPLTAAGRINSTQVSTLFDTVTEATLVEEFAATAQLTNTVAGTIKPFVAHSGNTYNLPPIPVAAASNPARAAIRVQINVVLSPGWSFGFSHDLQVSAPGDVNVDGIAFGGVVR